MIVPLDVLPEGIQSVVKEMKKDGKKVSLKFFKKDI